MDYQYKVVGAPERGLRKKGAKTGSERIAAAFQEVIVEHALDGWEYLRTDLVPCVERAGLFGGTREVHRAVMVFRRDIRAAARTRRQQGAGDVFEPAPQGRGSVRLAAEPLRAAPEPGYRPSAEPHYGPSSEPHHGPAAEPQHRPAAEPAFRSAPEPAFRSGSEPAFRGAAEPPVRRLDEPPAGTTIERSPHQRREEPEPAAPPRREERTRLFGTVRPDRDDRSPRPRNDEAGGEDRENRRDLSDIRNALSRLDR